MKPASTYRRRLTVWKHLLLAAAVVLAAAVDTEAGRRKPRGNAVTNWNAVATAAFLPSQGTDPLTQSRTYAILHAAIHDALNAVDPRYVSYTAGLVAAPFSSSDAAVAAASRDVLMALIPDQHALIETAYTTALAAIPHDAARSAGIAVGQAAAAAVLAKRQADGLDAVKSPIYAPMDAPGDYQFTAPFDFALFPGWRRLTPFAIDLSQHRLPGPELLGSPAYAIDFNDVKEVGRIDSRQRTAEQSEIAKFWYEDSPIGWNRIANTVIQEARLDPWSAARVLALVNFAMADGFVAGFDAKYQFRFWRPITAIQQAADDGNVATTPDVAWTPFLTTPPVPDYPSTHTVLGAAAAEVLIHFFGDRVRFRTTSATLPGVTRRFNGFSHAADENGRSRIYAGIHFGRAVADGYGQGQSVGRKVARALPPLDEADSHRDRPVGETR